jgi:hypothetical protein
VCWTYLNCASFSRTKTSTLCLRRVYSASEHAILFSTQPSSAFGNTCGNGSTDYSTKQVRYRHTTFDFSNTIFSLVDVNAKPSLDHGTGSFLPGDRRSTKGRPIASALPVRQKPHPPPVHLRLENRPCLTRPSKTSSLYRTNQNYDRPKDTTSAITRA